MEPPGVDDVLNEYKACQSLLERMSGMHVQTLRDHFVLRSEHAQLSRFVGDGGVPENFVDVAESVQPKLHSKASPSEAVTSWSDQGLAVSEEGRASTCPVSVNVRNDWGTGDSGIIGDVRSLLEKFLLQIKEIVAEEINVVTTGQDKFEGIFSQWLDFENVRRREYHRSMRLSGAYGEMDCTRSSGMRSSASGMQCSTLVDRGTTNSDGSADSNSKTSSSHPLSLSERVARTLSAEKKDLRKNLSVNLSAAKSSARKSVTEAFAQKSRMMSSAFQAKILNQELDDHSFWVRTKCRITFEKLIFTAAFDAVSGILIVLNSLVIGAEIEYNARHQEPSLIFQVVTFFFASAFTLEFCIRFFANHLRVYFTGPERVWNVFDLFMVMISLMEVVDPDAEGGGGPGSILRLVKMVRLFRIARVMRFVPQLRVMIFMILESTKSLVWLLAVLATILYVFAIIFTMATLEHTRKSSVQNFFEESLLLKHYGNVVSSLYSCLKAITSGQSWGELMDPLLEISPFYVAIFVFYIVFSVFALFNIITGVFVDGALEKSENDRDLVVQKELAYKKSCIENLKTLFVESDEDKSGAISVRELEVHMQDPRFESYLSHLTIDTSDVNELFQLLDTDGSGYISAEEFVVGMMHLLRGQTTEQSLRRMLKESRTLKAHLRGFMDFVESELTSMKHVLTASLGSSSMATASKVLIPLGLKEKSSVSVVSTT